MFLKVSIISTLIIYPVATWSLPKCNSLHIIDIYVANTFHTMPEQSRKYEQDSFDARDSSIAVIYDY